MKLTLLLLLLCTLLVQTSLAQIGMGGQPHPSAVLDLKATDKGFYPPRLTTVQRKAITNAQPGMFVYDLDQSTFYLFDGANWLPLAFQNPASIMPTTRLASDGAGGEFGNSVAISGDYAIVGARYDGIGANTYQGSAYIFVRSGSSWTQQAKLTATDGAAYDRFGFSVAISGDYAMVGAHADEIGLNHNQGSAYIFVRSGSSWTQQAKLTATDGAAYDSFGFSVAISGDYAMVGAYAGDIDANNNQGSAYIFVRSGSSWTQQAKLTATDGAAHDSFGNSVAISGDYALVGVCFNDIGANRDQGSAYIFVRSGSNWTQQAKLTANDGEIFNLFGYCVAISGDYALMGAWAGGINSNNAKGSAYIFVRSGSNWTQQAKLTANDGAASDYFGYSVAISGDYAFVGASGKYIGGNKDQGAAYIFRRNGTAWPQLRAITDTSPSNTQNGTSVGISNGSFIIGGPGFESGKGKVSFGVVEN
jgi:hypothetical protein